MAWEVFESCSEVIWIFWFELLLLRSAVMFDVRIQDLPLLD